MPELGVDDRLALAEIADVSLRTFGNYFSSKYEAICAIGTDRARRIGAALLARPADEPLWEAIPAAVLAHYEGAGQAPDGEWMAVGRGSRRTRTRFARAAKSVAVRCLS